MAGRGRKGDKQLLGNRGFAMLPAPGRPISRFSLPRRPVRRMEGLNSWWAVAIVTEGLALVAWLLTLRTRQVRFTFVVGFNAILPVTLIHLG